MTAYTKFYQFTDDLAHGKYNFASDTIKVMLTNTAPSQSNAILSDITEITAHNGYSAGGTTTTITDSTSSGVYKAVASNVTFTASGGTIGPFRYVVIYDATPTTPLKPLIGFADYGSNLTLNDTDTFQVQFDGTNGLFQIA